MLRVFSNKSILLALFLIFVFLLFSACDSSSEEASPGQTTTTQNSAQPEPTAPPTEPNQPSASQGAPLPAEPLKLEVLQFFPQDQVKSATQVVAMFNQPMAALGDFANVPAHAITLEPPVSGSLRFLNQYTLAFVPDKPLERGGPYTATLSSDLKSLTGETLGEPLTTTFSFPPLSAEYVTDVDPTSIEEALSPHLQVLFSQNVELEDLTQNSYFLYESKNDAVKVPTSWTQTKIRGWNGKYYFEVSPKRPLPQATSYSLVYGEDEDAITIYEGSTFGKLTPTVIASEIANLGGEQVAYVEQPLNYNYVTLGFSNPVKMPQALDFIDIDPPLPSLATHKKETQERLQDENAARANLTDPDTNQSLPPLEYLQYSSLNFWAPFPANTVYTVTFKKGLPDIFGQELTSNVTQRFLTGPYPVRARLDKTGGIMEVQGPHLVSLTLTNMDSVRVVGYALTEKEAIELFATTRVDPTNQYYEDFTYENVSQFLSKLRAAGSEVLVPTSNPNQSPVTLPVNLDTIFGDKLLGHLLFLTAENQAQKNNSVIQVTDIGLTVKLGRDQSLAWTTSLQKGEILPNVALTLYNRKGAVLWSGQTDDSGLAILPGTTEIEGLDTSKPPTTDEWAHRNDLFLAAKVNGQIALQNLNWEKLYAGMTGLDYLDLYEPDQYQDNSSFLITSQPIYKPGETVSLKIIGREIRQDLLQDLDIPKVRVIIRDPSNQLVQDQLLDVSPYGTVSFEFPLPSDTRYGQYEVYLDRAPELNRKNTDLGYDAPKFGYIGFFRVLAYRTPAFEVSFPNFPKEVTAGDKITLTLASKYHYGAPLKNVPATYQVDSIPNFDFTLPGLTGWTAINSMSTSQDDSGEEVDSEIFTLESSGEVTLNDQGEGKVDFLVSSSGSNPIPRIFTVNAKTQDVDTRVVSHAETFVAHPANLYAALKLNSFLFESQKPVEVELLTTDPKGVIQPGVQVEITTYRRFWTTVRRRSTGGVYPYVSKFTDQEIDTQTLTSSNTPVKYTVTPEKSGIYWILAKIRDQNNRENTASVAFYVSGEDTAGWNFNNDDILTLLADKASYAPGETAHILIQSPFTEALGLMTVERAGVRRQETFKVTNQSPVIDIPIGAEDSPNIFVGVVLVRGRISDKLNDQNVDLGKPTLRFGYIKIPITNTHNLLTVNVTPEKDEYRPRDEVQVALKVQDSQGNNFNDAEVAVIVVDDALLQLGGTLAYYPEKSFHARIPLLVRTLSN
ncbi:MAG: hypothetical protein LBF22_02440, partial [Deltaproteobacteria bacterium]|nr:hypothetical protein [Deltaproteobacteria bacterium]